MRHDRVEILEPRGPVQGAADAARVGNQRGGIAVALMRFTDAITSFTEEPRP
jgi:hypothetical protein